jgi:signal transduction histidine kinase
MPVTIRGQDEWFVMAEATSTIDEIEARFRRRFLFLWFGSMVFLAILARWYVNRSLRPILLLTLHAEELTGRMSASRAYSATSKLPVQNPFDEVGRLATNFNVLFDRVDSVVQQMRRFVSDAAHELRTPLAILRGETQLLLAHSRALEENQRTLLTIDSELATMGTIIEGLFTLSMADAGQLAIDRRLVHLEEVLEEACGIMASLARKKHISITLDHLQDCLFYGDQPLLRQLFLILIDNAVKYSPEYSNITVGLRVTEDECVATVRDEGSGIGEEHLPHIFKRFYRAAPQTSEEARSGGLGLAIASAIAVAHNGFITCESTLGQGSCFTITFLTAQTSGKPETRSIDEKATWIRVASTLP